MSKHGVLPFMFSQTKRRVLDYLDPKTMLEHIYMNFWEGDIELATDPLKEIFILRYHEQDFLSAAFLENYGLTYHMYRGVSLKELKFALAQKYMKDINRKFSGSESWSPSKFKRKYPSGKYEKCKDCGVQPVDLHHLLFREVYPNYTYDSLNVVPVCVQVHSYITRGTWTEDEQAAYDAAVTKWLSQRDPSVFDDVLKQVHQSVYGAIF